MSDPCKILIVDDEPLLKSLIMQKFRTQINAKQLEFQFAGNGLEAIEKLNQDKEIGIIVTDIRMPAMDGLTLLNQLNLQNQTYQTIVISAFGDMQNIRRAMSEGATDFILKPFDIMDFEISLINAVERNQSTKQNRGLKNKFVELSKEIESANQFKKAYSPLSIQKGVDIAGSMLIEQEIQSDFFDFFPLDEKSHGIMVADFISEKLALAFNTTRLQMLARGAALAEGKSDEIHQFLLSNMNHTINGLFFGLHDSETKQLHYACSGNVIIYLMPCKGSLTKLDGLTRWHHFKEHDILFITTSKLFELQNEGTNFSEETIQKILTNSQTAEEALQKVKNSIKEFMGHKKSSTDIPFLCIYSPIRSEF